MTTYYIGSDGRLTTNKNNKKKKNNTTYTLTSNGMLKEAVDEDIAPVRKTSVQPIKGVSSTVKNTTNAKPKKTTQNMTNLMSVYNNKDFATKSGYVSTKSDGFWEKLSSKYGMGYNDLQYEYINNQNNIRDKIESEAISWGSDTGKTSSSYKEKALDYMTDDEIAVYNYYYRTEGKKKAQEFLDELAETLNARKAGKDFEKMEGNTAWEVMYGIASGTEQFNQGVKSMWNMILEKDDYIPQTPTQITSSLVREDLADNGGKVFGNSVAQVGFDALNTGTNMLPSVAVGSVNPLAGAILMGGSASGNAYQEDLNATGDKDKAKVYATTIGALEASLQYALGGIGKLGGTSHAIKNAVSGIENGAMRFALEYGGKIGSEALEEGLQEVLNPIVKNAVHGTDESVDWENVAYSAMLGGLMGGVFGSTEVANSHLTTNEQKVVNKIYQDAVAEQESNGRKLKPKEKTKIYDETLKKLEKGYIDIETIEEVLGGKTYTDLKSVIEQEAKLQKEYDVLYEMKRGDMTGVQTARETILEQKLNELKAKNDKTTLKELLDSEMSERIKGTRLVESYNEIARREQELEVDLESYKNEYAKKTAQNFKEYGANNTNASHDFLDLATRVAEDRGYYVDFKTTAQLEQSLRDGNPYNLDVEATDAGAFVNKGTKTIVINMDANKSLQSLVGHEVMHTFEGNKTSYSEVQKELFKYAELKGEYNDRLESVKRRYGNLTSEEQMQELASDLLGSYVFSDTDFVNNLSTEKPGIFRKVYNEIKYLCKMATAGSKELRQLERVKRQFEKAWAEAYSDVDINSTAEVKTDTITQYSLADSRYQKAVEKGDTKTMQKLVEKTAKSNGYKVFGWHGTNEGGFTEFDAKYSDDGISLFISKNKETAQSYTDNYSDNEIDLNSNEKQEGLYRVGVKFDNPYVVDAKGKNWNQLTNEKIESRFSVKVLSNKAMYGSEYTLELKERSVVDDGRYYKYGDIKSEIYDDFDSLSDLVNALPDNMAQSLKRSIGFELLKKDSKLGDLRRGQILMNTFFDTNQNGERVGMNTTREWSEYAKENGYDGVIVKDVYDLGGNSQNAELERGDIYIAFDGNQIKSLNPATYDDAGNVIPLSERFNYGKKDIRYSLSEVVDNVSDRLSMNEWKQVQSAIADHAKRNYHYEKSANSDTIIPINNKLVYTDGNYESPGINKVIEFDSVYEDEIDEARKWIYEAEKNKSEISDAYEIIESLVGHEFINEYIQKGGKFAKGYDRRTSRGKSQSDSYHSGFLQDRIRRANEVINSVNKAEASSEDGVFFDGQNLEEDNTTKDDESFKVLDGGSVTKYSLNTWTPETQAKAKDNLIKVGFEEAKVDKWISDVNGVASVIASDKARLDFEAADNQTMLKNNQEYVKTLDASTLCAKRLLYQGTFDAIQHRLPNTMLSSDDLIDLLNMMKKHGEQTPCSVCYVESRRRHLGKFAQEWLDGYDGEYIPKLDEVTTSDGLEKLRKSHPDTYNDFVTAMNRKGSANPKVVQLRTEYRNEILSLTPSQIKKITDIGGLRVQSFSDFETPHLLDMMQAVMDMSSKGLTSQAYTKVPNFAWVFGDTGIKINLSLIAEGDGFDANGNLAFSSTEGMDIDDAMALRDAYSDNVGTIIVGANDNHILACMADNRIDYIIPFHRSGWGSKELEMMGMDAYKDYTYGQNEHSLETGKNVKNLYPPDYWDYKVSGKENAERYLRLCEQTGREPKFSNFLVDNGDGSYSLQPDGSTDGYWKLLIDFKMYDNNGNGVEQQKVQPNFNMTEAYRVLDEYEGGANKLPVANAVVEEFVAKHNSDIAPVQNRIADDELYKSKDYGHSIYSKDVTLQSTADIAPTEEYVPSEPDIAPVREDAPAREDSSSARIMVEEPQVEGKKNRFWSQAVELLGDKGYVFEKLSKKTKNRELEAKWNYIRYANGKAQDFIGNGAEGVRSLDSLQKEVKQAGLTQPLYEYVYHLHNIDRMSLSERYEDTENKAVFGDSVTADVSRATVAQLEAQHPELKKYADEIYSINNYLRDLLVEGGVISQETADLWAEMYPHYVPIRRAGEYGLNINVPLDTGKTGINAPVKQATGGNADILPLFDTMAQRAMQTYKAVAKNRFGVELKNTLGTTIGTETADIDSVIDGVDNNEELLQKGKNGRRPTFTVFEGGEKVTFEITEDMYDALKPTSEALQYTNKIANTISKVHRGVLTEYNPSFLARNVIKDTQDVLMNSQHPMKTYANFPRAIKEMATNGKWYKEYVKNGGEQNSYFDNRTNTFKSEDTSKFVKALGMPLNVISTANNYIERLPRLAEYIASRESGKSVEVSMLDSARVTTNFVAGGDLTKFLNRNGATFLNASVQGVMQQARNVQEAKMNGLKGWAQLATKCAVASIPAMLLNHLMWDDDEEYEELSDYVKQNYYIVAKYGDGKFVRIPKGRTLAVIQDALEQTMNALTGNDEVDLNSFVDLVVTNLAPNNPVEDNIVAPIVQAVKNKTWYGEDLVPTRLQDLPAEEQFDETTDSLSIWLGEKTGLSPYKINYLLDQYSGAVGDSLLPMLTSEAESGDDTIVGKLTAPIRDAFTTDSVLKNQNVSDFYSMKDELAINANKSGATDEDILSNKYINSVGGELGKLYAEKRAIQSGDYSDSEKYYLVRELQKKINALSKEALSEYGNVYIEDSHATVGDRQYRLTDEGWQKITDKQLEKQDEVTMELGITRGEYWSNKEEYDYAYDNPEKYEFLTENDISVEEYKDFNEEEKEAWTWAFKNPDKRAIAETVVGDYVQFREINSELNKIYADKDSNGKSISGTAKRKKTEYINSLDLDYGQKIILYRSLYDSKTDKATYNAEIVEYLNSRDDISYEEMVTILTELDMKVQADGTVTW